MYNESRVSQAYIQGIVGFLKAAVVDMHNKGEEWIFCPCVDCDNTRQWQNPKQIEAHLIRRGFKEGYTCWSKHGEEAIIHEDNNNIDDTELNDMPNTVNDDQPDGVDCASDDEFSDDEADSIPDLGFMLRDVEGNHNDGGYKQFIGMLEDSEKPLYSGCKTQYTRLSSVLELLKLKASSGWSDKSFTAMLGLFADMLPEGNELPKTNARRLSVPWEWKLKEYMLVGMTVSCTAKSMRTCFHVRSAKHLDTSVRVVWTRTRNALR